MKISQMVSELLSGQEIITMDRWTDRLTDIQIDGQGKYCRAFADFDCRGPNEAIIY